MHTVFLQPDTCVGCRHCEVACGLEHSKYPDVLSYVLGEKDSQPRLRVETGVDFMPYPNRCRHCHPAPCEQACPSGAVYRDRETGAVLVDSHRCIACWMCVMVCPFSSMGMQVHRPQSGRLSALKCDACVRRLREDKTPACVRACKTQALQFGKAEQLLDQRHKQAAVDMTMAAQGLDKESLPENLRLFQGIRKSLAALGPMPSSSPTNRA